MKDNKEITEEAFMSRLAMSTIEHISMPSSEGSIKEGS